MAKTKAVEYGDSSISALKGADRVRKRPAVIFSLKPAVKYCLLVIINSPILCIVSVNNENIISALIGCVNDVKSGRWERLRTKITVYYVNE